MVQEKESRFAIWATLCAFGLVMGISFLLWLVTSRVERAVQTQPTTTTLASDAALPNVIKKRVSVGAQSLFPEPSEGKSKAVEAIANGEYDSAVTAFNGALSANPNDPEAFIYRNNARIGDDRAYAIAVVAPAGESSEVGMEILRGVAQAQDDINRNGGISGTPIKLVLVNDENDPNVAKAIANSLVKDDSILGVVGHYSSDATLATAPIYEKGQLVSITPVSTAVDLSGVSPYLYRTVPSDSFAAAALAAYMLYYNEDRSAAVFYDSEHDLSSSLKEEFDRFVSAWGGDITAEYDMANGFDANALFDAESQGADTVMIAASPKTLSQSAEVINANEERLPVLGGDELYNRALLAETKANAQALTVAVPWHLLSRDTDQDFVESSRKLWEGDINWRTAAAYDAVMTLAFGLKENASRAGLKDALDSTDFQVDSATGSVDFLPSGDRRQVDRLVQVEPGTRSGAGFDFVPFTLD